MSLTKKPGLWCLNRDPGIAKLEFHRARLAPMTSV